MRSQRRAAISAPSGSGQADVPALLAQESANAFLVPELPFSLPDYLERIEKELIARALVKARYNRTHAAELLGVSFRQLRYQIQKLKIHDPE